MKRSLIVNKAILTVVALNVAQVGILIGILVFQFLRKGGSVEITFDSTTISFFVIILIAFFNSSISIKDIYSLGQANARYEMLKETLSQLEDLNKTLRSQRHDFMNHLQVVYSLIEMDEYKDAGEYIQHIYNDIQRVSQVMRTSNPAVNALLQAKVSDSEKRGIVMELTVTSGLHELKIPPWEFCRVLGNITDNAIHALEEIEGNKAMQVELFEDLKSYRFRVKNNGPLIPEELQDKIFEAGFSTKGEKGEGMGLAIAKEILLKYGGDINVSSGSGETVFEGYVPK